MSVGGILKQIAVAAWRVLGMLLYVTLSLVVLATGTYYWRRYQQNHEVEQPPTHVQRPNSPALTADPRLLNIVGAATQAGPESDTPPPILVSKPDRPAQRVLLSAATPAQLREAFRFLLQGGDADRTGLVPVAEGGKKGYLDRQGRWIFPPQFDSAGPFIDGRARVSWGRPPGRTLAGWIDTTGRWLGKDLGIHPPDTTGTQWTVVGRELLGHRVARSNENSRVGVVDQSGNILIPLSFAEIILLDTGDVWAMADDRAGVMDVSQSWRWTRPSELASYRLLGDLGGGLLALGDNQSAALIDYRSNRTIATGFERLMPTKAGLIPAMRQGRWGFIDRSGHWIIEAKYDWAQPSLGGSSLASREGTVGWIDASGKEHLSSDFAVLQLSDDGHAVAAKDCGVGIVDASGQWTLPPTYESVTPQGEGFFAVRRNGGAGLVNGSGQFLTSTVPDGPRKIGEVATDIEGGGWQFIDTSGQDLGPDVLEQASDFREGHAVVAVNRTYGVIDTSGNLTVPLIFREALHEFHEGRAAAKSNWGRWGYIDGNCHWVIPPVYDRTEDFANGTAEVGRGQEDRLAWSRIDKSGTEVRDPQSEFDNDTREGLRRLALNGRWGFVDAQQQWVIPAQFEDEGSFSESAAAVQRAGKWGFIDKSGKVIVPEQFEAAGDFHDGLARVRKKDLWMYVNQHGELLNNGATFSDAGDFSEGTARVKTSAEKWGYINKTGGWLIEPAYIEAADFSSGHARVRLRSGPYRTGKSIHPGEDFPLRVDDAGWLGSGLGYVCARQNFNRCALINAVGELVIPAPSQTESAR